MKFHKKKKKNFCIILSLSSPLSSFRVMTSRHIGLHQPTSSDSLLWVDIPKDEPPWLPDVPIFDTPLKDQFCFVFDFRNGGSWDTVDCTGVAKPFICRKLACKLLFFFIEIYDPT